MKPYIIFDMDGVIIDSESWYMDQLKEFLHSQGYDIPKKHLIEMRGLDAKGTFKKLEKYIVNQDKIQYLFEKYLSQIQIPNYQQIVFPHVQECIEDIFQKDIDIIIASSSPREVIEKVLIELKLYAYISYFVGREDVQYSKPNPEIYLSILKHQNGKNHYLLLKIVLMEYRAAKQAGLKVVAYYSGKFQNDQSESDLIITDHLQIIDIIMGGKNHDKRRTC